MGEAWPRLEPDWIPGLSGRLPEDLLPLRCRQLPTACHVPSIGSTTALLKGLEKETVGRPRGDPTLNACVS